MTKAGSVVYASKKVRRVNGRKHHTAGTTNTSKFPDRNFEAEVYYGNLNSHPRNEGQEATDDTGTI